MCGSAQRPKKLVVKKRCPRRKGRVFVGGPAVELGNQSIDYVKGTFSRFGDDQKNRKERRERETDQEHSLVI